MKRAVVGMIAALAAARRSARPSPLKSRSPSSSCTAPSSTPRAGARSTSCCRRRATRSSSSRTRPSPWRATPPPPGKPSPRPAPGHPGRPLVRRRGDHRGRWMTPRSGAWSIWRPSRPTPASPSCNWPARRSPGAPPAPLLPPKDGFIQIDPAKFASAFAADVDPATTHFMAASQVPWGLGAVGAKISAPAWKAKPSYYLLATQDLMIPPAAQRAMALAGQGHARRDLEQPRGDAVQARRRRRLHRDGGRRGEVAPSIPRSRHAPAPWRRLSPCRTQTSRRL
jgi:hypothetical protein